MDINEMMKKLLKDPEAIQKQAREAQERVAAINATGSAGGGMVKITLNGAMQLMDIHIDPEVLKPEEAGMLRDLIKAAHNDASQRVQEAVRDEMARNIPGFHL